MISGITRRQIANMSLEEDFRKVYEEATARMQAKEDEALKLVREIEAIAEETGIPFSACLSPLSQTFQPNSFHEKWGETLNEELEKERTWGSGGTYKVAIFEAVTGDSPGEYEGWQHSAVCY